jgi:hypothetical protein
LVNGDARFLTDLERDESVGSFPAKEDIMTTLDALPRKEDIMNALDALPSREQIADMLRQLTVRSEPPGHLLGGIGILAAGILTGAALAVLFAPKPGAELRQEIGTRVRGLSDKIAKTEQRAARKPA